MTERDNNNGEDGHKGWGRLLEAGMPTAVLMFVLLLLGWLVGGPVLAGLTVALLKGWNGRGPVSGL